MKICVTGCTAMQIGRGVRIGYDTVIDQWVRCMRYLGHEVDHRRVEIDEDVSKYDRFLIGLVPFGSIAATYFVEAILLLAKVWDKARIYVDDWKFTVIPSHVLGWQMYPKNRITDCTIVQKAYREFSTTTAGMARIQSALDRMVHEDWPPVLMPKFGWGDPSSLKIFKTKAYYFLDNSSYTMLRLPQCWVPKQKNRKWTLGILSNQLRWLEDQKLTWPLEHFGSNSAKAHRLLQESELARYYTDNWGVLSPPYAKLPASGWWRNRFLYAAAVGSIWYGVPSEAPQLGTPYRILSPGWVESLTDHELEELATAQREVLYANLWTKEEFQQRMAEAIG